MGQSPSAPVMEQSPWVHEMEQNAWDHEMGQSPWAYEIDQSPWVPEMDQSPWVTEMEQSRRVHEMEQSHRVHEMEQSPWIPEMEQSPWIPKMEQSPWVLEMGQTPLHPEMEHITLFGEPYSTRAPLEVKLEKKMQLKKPEQKMPMRGMNDEGPRDRLHHEGGHFKVPRRLRQVNEEAYEPELISIGPCYRNKEHLRYMEEIKIKFFCEFFSQKEEIKNRCFKVMKRMEGKALKWYGASVVDSIDSENFVQMMVVDGCFIIELLCNEPKDPIATTPWSRLALFVDLLLLENQLPFFVLVKLYGLIKDPMDETEFASKAFDKLIQVLRLPISRIGTENPSTIKNTNKIDHLLGLVHDNWLPSPQGIDRHEEDMGERPQKQVERQSIRCARELEEAGIKFKKIDRNKCCNAMSLFDVNFTNGKMKIPTFVIDNNTERLFRNLIAYELFVQGSTYVIDYATLMDNLVNTANDVKLLRLSGVIQNMLGDDEAVAQMLNKLLDNVTLSGDTFIYQEIFDKVQKHCDEPLHTLMAKLKHDYFSTPWAVIGFLAALLLFLTTIITFILRLLKK